MTRTKIIVAIQDSDGYGTEELFEGESLEEIAELAALKSGVEEIDPSLETNGGFL